jgi:hypothetical protein
MNHKNTARVLDDIAQDHVPQDINLLPQITARIDKGKKLAMKTKTRLLIVALFVLVAVAVTLVSFPGVVTAMQRLFGYIPGVGIVEENAPIRVLAAPVTITRQGISVTVTSATLTADQTHIEYRIFGVPRSAYPDSETVNGCMKPAVLALPDGTRLTQLQNFPPVPSGVNQATLVIPCIMNTLPGKAPENWKIPLRFIPAPSDLTVMPVIELSPSPQVQPSPTLAAATAKNSTPAAQATLTSPPPPAYPGTQDNSVTVQKVVETNDGYILVGKFDPQVRQGDYVQVTGMAQIHDASGKTVAYTQPQDIQTDAGLISSSGGFGWAMQFKAAGLAYPLTVTFPGTIITQAEPGATARFTFDAGIPQPGQQWTPNLEIQLAGHTLKLISITSDSRSSYSFRFQSDSRVSGVSVEIAGYHPAGGGGGGGGGGDASSTFDVSVSYTELPKGKLTVVLSNLTVIGDAQTWQGQWSPATPRTDWPAAPTAQPGTCLSNDQIGQLQSAPADLTHGTALFYELLHKPGEVSDKWVTVLYPLDGNTGQEVAPDTNWATLSGDGASVAYPGPDGITLLNLATQAEIVLPTPGAFDLHLSRDGNQIAFVSTNADSVFVMDIRGASPVRRLSDQSYESIIGWSPDNRQVFIAIPYSAEINTAGNAWKIQAVDVATSAVSDLFTIENGSPKSLGAVLSPDGNWIAYRGRDADSLVLVRTDGTQMHNVIENSGGISGIAWSQSGWIGVSLYNPDNYERRMVLLQPDSCQAYIMPGLHGDLEGLFLP